MPVMQPACKSAAPARAQKDSSEAARWIGPRLLEPTLMGGPSDPCRFYPRPRSSARGPSTEEARARTVDGSLSLHERGLWVSKETRMIDVIVKTGMLS